MADLLADTRDGGDAALCAAGKDCALSEQFGATVVLKRRMLLTKPASRRAGCPPSASLLIFTHSIDLHVIAGQGTLAFEILEQSPGDAESILVPVGEAAVCWLGSQPCCRR